ncbi:MAG: DUF6159 family protein [Candidatus Thorarchaeota archaeon]|jgi:hypothetical protein
MARSDIYEYHQQEEFPSNTGKVVGLFVVFGAFIGLGVYALMNLWEMHSTDITNIIATISPLLANNLWLLGVSVLAIVFLSILMGLGASVAAKRLGGTLIYIGAGFMNLMTWGIVIVMIAIGGLDLSMISVWWPMLIPGLFTLFITLLLFTVFKDKIRRAGEIIKLTGQVTLDEKGTFVPPFLTMLFTLFSALLFGAILVWFMPQILTPGYEFVLETDWPYLIGIVVYLFVTIFFYNFAYSTTSAITYIYMRGRDPTLRDGIRSSMGVIGGLIVLSIMSVIIAIVRIIIRSAARKSGSAVGRGVGYAADGIIGWVWALVNYFTIPAMVAEELSATKAIKRSAGMVRKNFVDVMIKETAVRWGFGVLSFMFFIAFAAAGALFGWILTGDIFLTIVVTVVFTILAAIPSTLVLRTFDIVYVTLLYIFIRRKEGDITGKTVIPSSLNQELDNAYNRAQRSE